MESVNPVTTIGTQDKSPQATTAAAVAGAVPAATPWGTKKKHKKVEFPSDGERGRELASVYYLDEWSHSFYCKLSPVKKGEIASPPYVSTYV